MSWEEIFQPGLKHWKEYQDSLADKIAEVPAPGPGPGHVTVDLDKGTIVIEESAQVPRELSAQPDQDVHESGDENRTE